MTSEARSHGGRVFRVAAIAFAVGVAGGGAAASGEALPAGVLAPGFHLKQLGGGQLSLDAQRGKAVLLSFWTAGSPGCNVEAPHLERLNRRYSRAGLRVIGIAPLRGPVAELRAFVKRHGITYPTLVDPEGKVARRYDLRVYPFTVLIDRRGRVRAVHRGFRAGEERDLERKLRSILDAPIKES